MRGARDPLETGMGASAPAPVWSPVRRQIALSMNTFSGHPRSSVRGLGVMPFHSRLFPRMRDRFKLLLTETGYVTPGKKLEEVRVLFMGRESFDSLSEHDRQIIYDQHQKDITDRARGNFMVSATDLPPPFL